MVGQPKVKAIWELDVETRVVGPCVWFCWIYKASDILLWTSLEKSSPWAWRWTFAGIFSRETEPTGCVCVCVCVCVLQIHAEAKVGSQLWVYEIEIVVLFIDYCIIFIQTTVNPLLSHPVYIYMCVCVYTYIYPAGSVSTHK